MLQPGVANGNPNGLGRSGERITGERIIRKGLLEIGKRQFELFAGVARPVERRGERGGQRVGRFEAAADEARRLGIERRNPRSAFDHQHAAGQAFHNAAQAFPHAMVFFETGGQVAVRDFEFLAEMSDLPLQLPIGALERTRRLGERRKSTGQRMLGIARRISWCWKKGRHDDCVATAMPARHKLP